MVARTKTAARNQGWIYNEAPALFHHRDGAGDNDDRIKRQASHNYASWLRDP